VRRLEVPLSVLIEMVNEITSRSGSALLKRTRFTPFNFAFPLLHINTIIIPMQPGSGRLRVDNGIDGDERYSLSDSSDAKDLPCHATCTMSYRRRSCCKQLTACTLGLDLPGRIAETPEATRRINAEDSQWSIQPSPLEPRDRNVRSMRAVVDASPKSRTETLAR
jgi:hypothetical protein